LSTSILSWFIHQVLGFPIELCFMSSIPFTFRTSHGICIVRLILTRY
jgi:hypothetical protein